MLDETHDPSRRSWVPGADDATTDFPIQNLPYGVFRRAGTDEAWRVGVAIGDQVLDLPAARAAGLLAGAGVDACAGDTLNPLLALGAPAWRALRRALSELLRTDGPQAAEAARRAHALLVPQRDAVLRLPVRVGDYTDFYASVHHATNVGRMLRPDQPLLPNYKWVPIGYHGRASSLVPSGTPIVRPIGQLGREGDAPPTVGACRRLDYELELGLVVGPGNALGTTIPIGEAASHLFGVVLLNDWSARDMQAWEYQPLGPFLAKNFATTLSPWVVTFDALAPFRVPVAPRPAGDPAPLPYLHDAGDQAHGALDVAVEAWLASARMRAEGHGDLRLSRGNARELYWTPAQLLAHHASNGCNLQPGDVLGSGTISGPEPESRGCLLELTWRGTEPVALPTGEQRRFLEDGDTVTLRARASREGAVPIGFGACAGTVQGAPTLHP